ncbi:anthranilate phosphoribosyltransferase [Granulicella aggregans]|uniref:anthranilate phosphoribosyltransferase n=1 Tax=Granulicella aggregans TaxID=474949 RepID=UPI0016200336|nr:anthranilate phosphoribosyltransferase [Granulicella aggregans]
MVGQAERLSDSALLATLHKVILRPYLRRLIESRATLTREEARDLMRLVLQMQATEIEIAAILGALAARGETAEEIAGFVDAMREAAAIVLLHESERTQLVDTCGTGGDGADTFNISTGAALVAAAAGAKVAKHGNRAVTSKSGSADVLEVLGIPVGLSPNEGAAAIRNHGFAYLHAPAMHPAMKAVMPVRRALGVRTVFNLLGPLSNPAGARAQVMGVYAADRVAVVAEAMVLLGVRHAFVVHGYVDSERSAGMDEFSISAPSLVAEVRDSAVTHSTLSPEDAGLERSPIAMLRGGDALENATILRAVFAGKPGPCRDVVVLNAAAVLVTAGLASDLRAGVVLAQETIDAGRVLRLVESISAAA